MSFSYALASSIASTLRMPLGSLSLSTPSLDSLAEHSDCSPHSTSSTCSCPSGASHVSSSSDAASVDATSVRPNEYLAVLIPKNLWKPDSQAPSCETFTCTKRFSIFERKHHCRKCGGVFCNACSSRRTTLLDTSQLDFLHPPRNTPIVQFVSPISPLYIARICDLCFEQLYGLSAIPAVSPRSRTSSGSSSVVTLTLAVDAPAVVAIRRPSIRQQRLTLPSASHETTTSKSELDSYPLRLESKLCKSTGGGRWIPKKCLGGASTCLPGQRPVYEVEMEEEEERQRRARENPIIKDGDFQIRITRNCQPDTP